MMRFLLLAASLALVYYVLFVKGEDRWTGFIYPDASNLLVDRPAGDHPSLEACRAAALGMIEINEWRNSDYECGLNCKVQGGRESVGPMICEETKK